MLLRYFCECKIVTNYTENTIKSSSF